MIVLAALAATLPAAAPAEIPEIVVIARRLEGVSVWVGRDRKGRLHCGMDGTTGVERLDKKLCKTTAECVRKGAGTTPEVRQCVAQAKPKLLEDIQREFARRRQ